MSFFKSLSELLWQTATDQATMLELAAWRAEQEGDSKGAKALEDGARVLAGQAEQHRRTMEAIEKK